MTAVTLPNSGLKAGWVAGEAAWGPEMNRNLRALDALVQARVIDKDLNAPPAATGGSLYIVGPSPTGAWAGQAGKLALYQTGDDSPSSWVFITPKSGWSAWVVDESVRYTFDGSTWVAPAKVKHAQVIGDGTNPTLTVTHALGSRDVHVSVYRNSTPWENFSCTIGRPTVNTITLSNFSHGIPAVNELRVVVSL